MAEIYSIVYSPTDGTPEHPETHFQRVLTTAVALIADYGIEGDRKGGSAKRHVNIMTREVMQSLAAEGYKTEPGALGEQITISGLDLVGFAEGTRVRLGDAVIEVVKPRTGCDRFEAIQGLSRLQAKDRLGVMARVVTSGTIRVGDPVALITEPVAQSS